MRRVGYTGKVIEVTSVISPSFSKYIHFDGIKDYFKSPYSGGTGTKLTFHKNYLPIVTRFFWVSQKSELVISMDYHIFDNAYTTYYREDPLYGISPGPIHPSPLNLEERLKLFYMNKSRSE